MDMVWVKVRDVANIYGHAFVEGEAELEQLRPAILEFIGFLVREGETELVLASQRCEEDKAYRELAVIPRECVLDKQTLIFPGKG